MADPAERQASAKRQNKMKNKRNVKKFVKWKRHKLFVELIIKNVIARASSEKWDPLRSTPQKTMSKR